MARSVKDTPAAPRRRGVIGSLALCLVVAIAAVAAQLTAPASASEGVTAAKLAGAGWTCFVAPSGPARIVCFSPGHGRPIPNNPDPPASYNFLGFDPTTGEFIDKGHLVRADLYRGQRCAPGDDPYRYLERIGYYECVRAKNA